MAEAQPAMAKAAGSARAPVPTIRLKMYTAAVPAEKLPEVCSAISGGRELQGTFLCDSFQVLTLAPSLAQLASYIQYCGQDKNMESQSKINFHHFQTKTIISFLSYSRQLIKCQTQPDLAQCNMLWCLSVSPLRTTIYYWNVITI